MYKCLRLPTYEHDIPETVFLFLFERLHVPEELDMLHVDPIYPRLSFISQIPLESFLEDQ